MKPTHSRFAVISFSGARSCNVGLCLFKRPDAHTSPADGSNPLHPRRPHRHSPHRRGTHRGGRHPHRTRSNRNHFQRTRQLSYPRLPDLPNLFNPFWEVFQIVDSEFVDQPIDKVAMLQGALDAIATAAETWRDAQPTAEDATAFAVAAETPQPGTMFRPSGKPGFAHRRPR